MRITVRTHFHDNFQGLIRAVARGTFKSITQAAYHIRQDAVAMINSPGNARRRSATTGRFQRSARTPSPPGMPVHTHATSKGRFLFRRAILYKVDRIGGTAIRAVIGPRASVVGDVGYFHEFGKKRGDNRYPKRPVMGPALRKNVARFGRSIRGSVRR